MKRSSPRAAKPLGETSSEISIDIVAENDRYSVVVNKSKSIIGDPEKSRVRSSADHLTGLFHIAHFLKREFIIFCGRSKVYY